MGKTTINTIVESRFATLWGVTTPVAYDNVNFTPPVGGSWVSVKVREGTSRKITLGSGAQVRRTLGTAFVEIFTPVGIGSKTCRDYADQVIAVFRDARVSGVLFMESSLNVLGEEYYTNSGTGVPATSQQYQAVVAIPFRYDEVV